MEKERKLTAGIIPVEQFSDPENDDSIEETKSYGESTNKSNASRHNLGKAFPFT